MCIIHNQKGKTMKIQLTSKDYYSSIEPFYKSPPRPHMTKTQKVSISLGCDPEFELLSQDTEGKLRVIENKLFREPNGTIGYDGHALELRPAPAKTPKKLVQNIKNLIQTLPPISATGNEFPLGGHIHIGVPYSPLLLRALDDFLGKLTTPKSGKSRQRYGYGHLGDFERKCYGFEYRTPPSMLFSHPEIMRIVLKLVKALVYRIIQRGFEYEAPPQNKDYLKLITLCEYNHLIQFIHNYDLTEEDSKPINANWAD